MKNDKLVRDLILEGIVAYGNRYAVEIDDIVKRICLIKDKKVKRMLWI